MASGCLACELTDGDSVPGGRVHESDYWVVEHCIGPLGAGTLIVKPFRHCVHVSGLSDAEAGELGRVLKEATACVQELTAAEQVYVCLWSHMGGIPGHIHFVVQPSWARLKEQYSGLGPIMQAAQFSANELPTTTAVHLFCERARDWSGWSAA